jgi:hypothetical protein
VTFKNIFIKVLCCASARQTDRQQTAANVVQLLTDLLLEESSCFDLTP